MNLPNGRPNALFLLDQASLPLIYGLAERRELDQLANFYAPPQTRESIAENLAVLADVEVIFSGWGAAQMDEAFLSAAPRLKAVFYGAGSVNGHTSEAFWDRGILITSAYVANAQPVAEYTLSAILLSLKKFWRFAAQARAGLGWGDHTRRVPGGFHSTVAFIGYGMIARRVFSLLKPFDIRCLVYDPFLTEPMATALGLELCSLEDAFRRADVVTLHAADKPETRGMITGAHFLSMKADATFINTARGQLVREREMIDVLKKRPDLTAVLDVCDPEPPPADSPLLALPNIIVTSHIAGSLGPECQRLGRFMVDEFRRYRNGEPLHGRITRELAAKLA
jgi:phosphoglycerate dehydrogenase-like enzyme